MQSSPTVLDLTTNASCNDINLVVEEFVILYVELLTLLLKYWFVRYSVESCVHNGVCRSLTGNTERDMEY